jgi:hypothetical protein
VWSVTVMLIFICVIITFLTLLLCAGLHCGPNQSGGTAGTAAPAEPRAGGGAGHLEATRGT